ncbi:MAG: CinA family protein [Rhodoglobus sp.]
MLTARCLTIAVAESLSGGLLVAELIRIPGASAVVAGGIIAYNTELKHTLLGVDSRLLAVHGAVHPDVAAQMATGVRLRCSFAGQPSHLGISTTGVAGPLTQGGHSVGEVYLGFAVGAEVSVKHLQLSGTRDQIRSTVVDESLRELSALLL